MRTQKIYEHAVNCAACGKRGCYLDADACPHPIGDVEATLGWRHRPRCAHCATALKLEPEHVARTAARSTAPKVADARTYARALRCPHCSGEAYFSDSAPRMGALEPADWYDERGRAPASDPARCPRCDELVVMHSSFAMAAREP